MIQSKYIHCYILHVWFDVGRTTLLNYVEHKFKRSASRLTMRPTPKQIDFPHQGPGSSREHAFAQPPTGREGPTSHRPCYMEPPSTANTTAFSISQLYALVFLP